MYFNYRIRQVNASPFFLFSWYKKIRSIGHTAVMDEYEKRKLSVYNQVNFLGILSGITVSIAGFFDNQHLPVIASIIAFSPVIISSIVLTLNHHQKYEWSRLVYFSLYPVLTSLAYTSGMDLGLELLFVLYAAMAVFYMQKPQNAFISFLLSSCCYIIVYVFANDYTYQLRVTYFSFYVFVHILSLVLIFLALFWLKKENISYQVSILQKNEELHNTNMEIEKQKTEISLKADQLAQLNILKNKLFSVISHDLRGPIYAQRAVIQSIDKYDLPVEDIKAFVPELLKDMNHTVGLMDNLLQWAKSQMQAETVNQQPVEILSIINTATDLIGLQAKSKGVQIMRKLESNGSVYADENMLNLVLRNLLSNAIKFTEMDGKIVIETRQINDHVNISVSDSGIGMTKNVLEKISQNIFYSTKGTSNESGTGLGLMLCNEFLKKNGSILEVESQHGVGSTFSFKLPLEKLN